MKSSQNPGSHRRAASSGPCLYGHPRDEASNLSAKCVWVLVVFGCQQEWGKQTVQCLLTILVPGMVLNLFFNHNEVSGGCNIVRESLKAFRPPAVQTTMLIDVLAYDGFPAMSTLQDMGIEISSNIDIKKYVSGCFRHLYNMDFVDDICLFCITSKLKVVDDTGLDQVICKLMAKLCHIGNIFNKAWPPDPGDPCQEIADGNRMMCGSMMIDGQSETLVTRIANEVYNSCRNHSLSLPNFPQFDPIIESLKQGADDTQQKPFQVCRQVGGSLVVLQAYAQKWLDLDQTQCRANEIVSKHNEQYNPEGLFVAPERTLLGKI